MRFFMIASLLLSGCTLVVIQDPSGKRIKTKPAHVQKLKRLGLNVQEVK